MKRQTLFLLGLLLAVYWLILCSSPVKTWADEPTLQDPKDRSNVGSWLVGFYRETVSRVDGDRCPSEPSCSEYSLQAFRKHGVLIGWIMTVDRLIHEGSEETQVSPVVFSQGKKKIYDPVENNDFWWYRSEKP
jgi:hypothetical protein